MIPEKFISTTKVSPKQNQNQNQNSLLFISTIGILFKKIFLRIFSDNYKAQLDRMRSH